MLRKKTNRSLELEIIVATMTLYGLISAAVLVMHYFLSFQVMP